MIIYLRYIILSFHGNKIEQNIHGLSAEGLRSCQFPDDVNRDCPRTFRLLAFPPPDAIASPKIFY